MLVFLLYFAFASVAGVYAVTSVGTNIITGGNIGIGTTNPIQKLEVIGSMKMVDGNQGAGKYLTSDANGLASWGTIAVGSTEAPGQIVAFATACPSGWTEYTAGRGRYIVGTPASGTNAATVGTALTDQENRSVGSHTHTVDPANTSVSISDPGHIHTTVLGLPGSGSSLFLSKGSQDGYPGTAANYGFIGTSATGITASVDIASFTSGSSGSVAGTNAPYIQLTYCQKSAGADLAEWINSLEVLTPGTVVSIDHFNNEKIVASNKDYDSSVAGVISTKPGWLLGEEQKGNVQLALSGRVPVRVTTANGEIKRGDPITSSSVRGVGMLATKSGKIIGIAMEPLKKPYGTITVLLGVAWNDSGKLEPRVEVLEKQNRQLLERNSDLQSQIDQLRNEIKEWRRNL